MEVKYISEKKSKSKPHFFISHKIAQLILPKKTQPPKIPHS